MFIVFEGLDGSGSTTQVSLLTSALQKKGFDVVQTKEPVDDSPIGSLVRSALQKKWVADPQALQLLFTADRAQHLRDVIEPALAENKIVICDRYLFSTVAFGSLSVPQEDLLTWNDSFRIPDMTFFLKLDPRECISRIESRGEAKELFEKEQTLQQVLKTYEWLSTQFQNFFTIDASLSREEIHQLCREKVETEKKRSSC